MESELNRTNFEQRCVIVLGMHRSGTSAMTKVINFLGVDLGKNLVAPREDNPKGFWEHRDVMETHETLLRTLDSYWDDIVPLPSNWWLSEPAQASRLKIIDVLRRDFEESQLWGLKDPRMCGLMPMWHSIFGEIGCKPHFIILFRNPLEVAGSLHRRGGLPVNKSLLFWLLCVIKAEKETRVYPRVFVSFDQLMKNWRATAERISVCLQIAWPTKPKAAQGDIENFLDINLKHNHVPDNVLKESPEVPEIITLAYEGLLKAQEGNDDSISDLFTELNEKIFDYSNTFVVKAFSEHVTGKWKQWKGWISERDRTIARLNNEVHRLERQYDDIIKSKSWKVTAPLRYIYNLLMRESDR